MTMFRILSLVGCAGLGSALGLGACSSDDASVPTEPLGRTRAGVTLATAGFVETTVIDGLDDPTVVRFAQNGRVLVAEKGGRILSYDSLSDPTPAVLVDLSTNVHDFWDRGLLGMTIDPAFPSQPYLYVLYAFDGDPGGAAPKWGDGCPTPPGATADGCVIAGRLSRFTVTGNSAGSETVLIEGWRQQYPSHATGQVEIGPDGALYASGGDGASFNFVDYGQDGDPINPLADPPVAAGQAQSPPSAQGGALRSQSPRRAGGPVLLNGTVIRVDPTTGLGKSDNPLWASGDPVAQRVIAYGLRNPFRIAAHPTKNELWVADVGWNEWEEVNRLPLGQSQAKNFGWPCYEGANKQPGYDGADLFACESLYATSEHATPFFAYRHSGGVSATDACGRGSSSVTGVAFYAGTSYPAEYQGAMFFADYSRRCIYVMQAGTDGNPAPASARSFHVNAQGPVFLTTGPAGDLFYAALASDSIQRISYLQPDAAFTAAPSQGQAPLIVSFDGSSSVKPLPEDTLEFAWDLDGDGEFDDSSEPQPAFLYDQIGSFAVRLRVTDQRGVSDDSPPLTIQVTDEPPPVSSPPEVFIDTPAADLLWNVGDAIQFSGHASDAEDGELPASALSWQIIIQHCPDGCHVHDLLSFDGVKTGSFPAEDHDYPMHLELILTATDSSGQKRSARRSLDPKTVSLVFDTQPSNLELVVGPSAQRTPFARRVIAGSENSVSAALTQSKDGVTWRFQSWSDGLPAAHQLPSATAPARYVAVYTPTGGLTGQYFDALGFAGSALTRVDPVIDFDWGQGAPDAALGADTFSVRWTGQLLVDFAETYQFSTLSDDGVRLAIDGVSVIDNFVNHAPTLDTGSLPLTAGWHPIILEYFENSGGAQLELSWSSPSQPLQVVPESHLRPGCGAEASCGLGLTCSADTTCVPNCNPATCKNTRRCRLDGTPACVALCTGLSCPAGDVCRAGLCIDACSTVTCGSHQHCVLGMCVDHPPNGEGGAGGGAGATGQAGESGHDHGGSSGTGGAAAGAGGHDHEIGGDAGIGGHQHGEGGANAGIGGHQHGDGGNDAAVGGSQQPGDGGRNQDDGGAPAAEGGRDHAAGAPGSDGGTRGGAVEGGAAGMDGAAPTAGQAGAPTEPAGENPLDPRGGCSCRVASGHEDKVSTWPWGALLLLALRRKARGKAATRPRASRYFSSLR